MRYLFNAPFIWSHDVIRLYLVPAIVYLAVSHAFAQNAHVSVDLLQYHIPRRARHLCAAVTGACVAVLFAVIARGTAARAWEEFAGGDILAGLIAWQVWPSSALVAAGSVLLTLRAGVHAVQHLRAALGGPERIAPPALSVDEDHRIGART
jgi:TRAP-type C4-dicarboxylate transport system permease small subunit